MFALYWNAYRKHIKWKEIWYGPGKIHATMIYPFVRMLQEKCRDLTEEQIHKTLWKEYEISGADRMFVERASKILEPYEGESEDEK